MDLHPGGVASAPERVVDAAGSVTHAARRALAALERKGRLTADEVVQAARDPGSPLHSYFTWDDAEAAHARRIDEARALIRSVRVIVTYETTTIAVPRYVRDTAQDDDVQGYVSSEQLRREPKNAKALLRYEFSRAAAHVARAVEIAKSIGLEPETRKVAKSIERLLGQLG
jgi:hypothetical protein